MVPMATERKGLCWPRQVFRKHTPESPETMCPNTPQPHWNNSHYITTYQQQFTGSVPGGPLKLDSLPDKTVATGMGELRPYAVQMMEPPPWVLVPSIPPAERSLGSHAPLIREHARAPPSTETLQPMSSKDMDCTANEDMDGKALPTSRTNSRGRLELREGLISVLATSHTDTRPHTQHTPPHTRPPTHRLGQNRGPLSWLDLQNSFSRTEAHLRFHQSNHSEHVDLRENNCSGRKHAFYGVNAYYLH
ncbi:uncharacterized protein LOC125306362 [Alosa alosa]|uniref:uncharacterized protein LOC125306362 n=1 Tax=Alosa alosa TaxID=278164 RepID=UPI002015465D|nr:uncharacterized protein LOC125306362 [Alosa alosa]